MQLMAFSDGVYVVGSKDYIIMETRVSNSKENAFQTEVTIVLPSSITLKRLFQSCTESYSEITCTIENPLKMGSTVSQRHKICDYNSLLISNLSAGSGKIRIGFR